MAVASPIFSESASLSTAQDLRKHVLDYLRLNRPEPGSRLATEAELVRSMKVSRSTVRRALGPLEREGWINRRAGRGTFVGPKIREIIPDDHRPEEDASAEQLRIRRGLGIIRVAVLIFNIGDLAHDWYTPGVLAGMDGAADSCRISVELLGDRDSDVDAISRRLNLSRPDVLVVLSNQPRHAFVIRDAQKLGIQCFVSGTPHRDLGVPAVCEDNRQAMSIATSHLIERGVKRIGLTLPRVAEAWVFDRLEAFSATVAGHAGVRSFVNWFDDRATADGSDVESMQRFIAGNDLDALIPCHLSGMQAVDALVRSGRVSVPDQLSVISFEQDHVERKYMGIPLATRVRFPLKQMGQTLAEVAKLAVEGKPVAQLTLLPADLVEGCSVRPVSGKL